MAIQVGENNSTGLQLFKACGFRLPSPVFTNTNKLYIHMYNSQKSTSYFKYNFLYLSSENGKGCGGKMFNYMGKFSSPLYPNLYRKDIECTWNVMVPKGYNVAFKFTDFNIGGVCLQNKVVVETNTGGVETESSFCAEGFGEITNSIALFYPEVEIVALNDIELSPEFMIESIIDFCVGRNELQPRGVLAENAE
ncbi:unnamed protein product [Ceutorhynchus assimilis]|uniref:CUB domain-containing protein n=1 Tax=Ceutorhynchus assimilis TaxID=467358 RepID=A0A9N9MBN0_9CUCU|nr:unnamed protein product [Ceutorhynchus assimilis]